MSTGEVISVGLTWVRNTISGSKAAAPWDLNHNICALANGQTVRRTIVTFDYWIDSNTTEFIDVALSVNYGVSLGTSNTVPTITPFTGASSTSPRWLYWDQAGMSPIEIFDVAGTVYYLTKNVSTSRYLDTRVQHKNVSGAAEYLWFGVQPDPTNVANVSDVYWAMSSSVLVEVP